MPWMVIANLEFETTFTSYTLCITKAEVLCMVEGRPLDLSTVSALDH